MLTLPPVQGYMKLFVVLFGAVILYLLIFHYMNTSEYHFGNFIMYDDEEKGVGGNDSKSLVYDHALSQERILELRKKTIHERCVKLSKTQYWSSLKPKGALLSYGGLTYCRIFKAGSTFWLSVLHFLAKDYVDKNGAVQKPYDIGRLVVHVNGPMSRVKIAKTHTPSGDKLLNSTMALKFMFSRNPYTRIWSAYIDKFVLPNYWKQAAKIVKPAELLHQVECANNITFEEFVLSIIRTPAEKLEQHWMPIHMMCSPCHVEFDVIGKMETFAEDYAYIIEKGKVDLVKDNMSKEARRKDEIEMLVTFYFKFIDHRKENCFGKVITAQRLWLAFQLNGYIHRNKTFPLTEFISSGKTNTAFLNIAFRAINSHTTEMERDLKDQKTSMMAEAYRRLPKTFMKSLKEIYKYDFELFGYDPKPTFLYSKKRK